MTTKYVESGETVKRTNFSGNEPEEKKFESGKETIKYHEQKLFYNYGTEQEPIIQDVLIEGPLMKASGIRIKDEGIKTSKKGDEYQKISYSMMLVFDLADSKTREESNKSLEIFKEAYLGCAKVLTPYKGKVGLHHFDAEHPEASLKDFVYWPRDNNGDIVKGKNPNIWVNFKSYGSHKTLITDLNGKPVDWALLKDVDLEIVPLFHIESNFVGTTKKVKVNLKSGIVIKIVPIASETCQNSTLEKYKSKYGQLEDEVESQLANLRLARQETLSQPSNSDFSDSGKMHDISPEPQKQSIQDFLSGAPSVQTNVSVAPQMPEQPSTALPPVTKLNIQPQMKIN
jgi:hypothetical protein